MMGPAFWLVLWFVAALVLSGLAVYPVAYRTGYGRAAREMSDRHHHRKGDRQETVLLDLPRAGRLPLARLADPTPLPGELADMAERGAFGPPVAEWVFAGGTEEWRPLGRAEYDLLTRPPDAAEAITEAGQLLDDGRAITTGEIKAIGAWVDDQIARWQAGE
jgi:hypothetical protein